MPIDQIACSGFAPSRGDRLGRRCALWVQLAAAVCLMISLGVAGTAVTIGIARADGVAATKAH